MEPVVVAVVGGLDQGPVRMVPTWGSTRESHASFASHDDGDASNAITLLGSSWCSPRPSRGQPIVLVSRCIGDHGQKGLRLRVGVLATPCWHGRWRSARFCASGAMVEWLASAKRSAPLEPWWCGWRCCVISCAAGPPRGPKRCQRWRLGALRVRLIIQPAAGCKYLCSLSQPTHILVSYSILIQGTLVSLTKFLGSCV